MGSEVVSTDRYIHPIKVCKALDTVLDDNSILIADGGDFVGTASYIVRPRGPLCWLDPGAFGTLGCGAGFALGAKAMRPDSEVWILYGDGACGWSIIEFDTFARFKMPVIAVIGNDACWSQMWRDQVKLLKDDTATTLEYARYDVVGKGLGCEGILIENEAQLLPGLQKAKEIAR